jgi:hypothetical protein
VSVVQALLSLQLGAVPAWQTPAALHTSRPSHTVVLSQVRPATPVYVQPVAALQVSSVQALLSLQVRAVPAAQMPLALHTSRPLHSVASSQVRPETGA